MNKFSTENDSMKPSRKELRRFGLTLGFCFFALALVLFFLKRNRYVYAADIGGILLIPAFFAPRWLSPVRRVWLLFGEALGFVITRIILAALFYLVMTPIAAAGKLFGERFLDFGFSSLRQSFWDTSKKDAPSRKENWERQF